MEGQDLRQTMVTIGLSIVFADLMLWAFGGDFYQVQTPSWLVGPIQLPLVTAVKSSGEPVYLLDVRQPWEHDTAALPGSVLIPLDQLQARAAEVRPPSKEA